MYFIYPLHGRINWRTPSVGGIILMFWSQDWAVVLVCMSVSGCGGSRDGFYVGLVRGGGGGNPLNSLVLP